MAEAQEAELAVSWLWILGSMSLCGMQFNIVNIILAIGTKERKARSRVPKESHKTSPYVCYSWSNSR